MVDVLHDASNTAGSFSGAANLSISLTIAANADRYLIVHIMQSRLSGGLPPTITAAAWGAQPLEKLWEVENASNQRLAAWGLKDPDAGASAVDLTFAAVADTRIVAAASSYYNVDQTTPVSAVYDTRVLGALAAPPKYVVGSGVGTGDRAVAACGAHASTSVNINPSLGAPPPLGVSGTANNAATGTSNTPALVTAANRFAGQTHFAVVGTKSNEVHSCATSGWQKLDQYFHPSGLLTFSLWYFHQVDATAPTAPTITWTTSGPHIGQQFVVADCDFDNPPAVLLGALATGNTSPHATVGAVSPSSRNALAMYFDIAAANTAGGAPGGAWTEFDDSAGSSALMRIVMGSRQVNVGNSSGAVSITGAVADWIQAQLLFATEIAQTERADLGGVGTGTLFVALNVCDELGTPTPVIGFTSNAATNTSGLGGGVTLKAAAAGLTVVAPPHTNPQTFFAPKLAARITAPFHTNAQQFFAPKIVRHIGAPFLTNTQQFFAPIKLRMTLKLATRFDNAQTFFNPALIFAPTPGVVEPPFYTNVQVFYGPSLLIAQKLTAPFHTNAQAFYGPTIYRLQRLTAPFHTSGQTFFGPTIARLQKLGAPHHVNVQAFFGPTIVVTEPGVVRPGFYINQQLFFGPTIFIPTPEPPKQPGIGPAGKFFPEASYTPRDIPEPEPEVQWLLPRSIDIPNEAPPWNPVIVRPEIARARAKDKMRFEREMRAIDAKRKRGREIDDAIIRIVTNILKE